jgi:hypothetical protein
MKVNIKALELIEKGLSSKTVAKLTESQINVLHSKLINEQVTEVPGKKTYKVGPKGGEINGVIVSQDPSTKDIMVTTKEGEMSEDDDFNLDMDQEYTGQQGSHDEYQAADDGMDDDTSPENHDSKMIGMSEEKKKSKKDENNPWAICTAQLGKEFGTRERHLWSAKENNKYERCVKDVKKSLKEQKNPVSLFLENEIIKIVERNLPPKITKKELMNYLNEAEPAVAPTRTKPTTKPNTRPSHPGKNPNPGVNPAPKADDTKTAPTRTKPTTKPGTRPSHPGKNPNPGVNPAPKAKKPSPEQTKDKVIDVIMQILNK